jgi:hypothetical protein
MAISFQQYLLLISQLCLDSCNWRAITIIAQLLSIGLSICSDGSLAFNINPLLQHSAVGCEYCYLHACLQGLSVLCSSSLATGNS